MMKITVVLLVATALASCGSTSADSASQESASATTAPTVVEIDTVDVHFDEDSPVTFAGAYELSEFVVLASIDSVSPGARFYGDTPEDPISTIYEDVFLNISVLEVLKGDPGKNLAVRWPAYFTTERSSSTRVAQLNVEGIVLNEKSHDGTYVMFLSEHPAPFGLSTTTLRAGMIRIDDDGNISGQRSSVFSEVAVTTLDELISDAGIQLDR